MTQALRQQRTTIDELDLELLRLINRRAQAVAEIGRLKREHSLPISDEAREASILNAVVERNDGPLNAASLRRIFGSILAESRRLQYQMGAESSCTK